MHGDKWWGSGSKDAETLSWFFFPNRLDGNWNINGTPLFRTSGWHPVNVRKKEHRGRQGHQVEKKKKKKRSNDSYFSFPTFGQWFHLETYRKSTTTGMWLTFSIPLKTGVHRFTQGFVWSLGTSSTWLWERFKWVDRVKVMPGWRTRLCTVNSSFRWIAN